jgi:PAT family acetyl-CoA transporter-like MFS transporter 1
VDGWALEILDESHLSYASTAQSVGQNVGFFLAFTVFLGANSFGWITLGQFVFTWGLIFIGSSILLFKFKYEPNPVSTQSPESIKGIYMQLLGVARLPDVKGFVFFLFTFHIGLVANDRALHLKFIECGFSKELLATLGLAGLPLSIGFAVLTGRLSRGGAPMSGPFFVGNLIRYTCGFLGMLLLWYMGDGGEMSGTPSNLMVFLLFLLVCLGTLGSSLVFVSMCAYFNQISPKHMGGSFLTFLNTCSNLGKSFWAPFIMYFIDMFGFWTVNMISLVAGTIYLIKSRPYLRKIEDTERMQFSTKPEGKI